jgi:predicted AlkP superfamily phosphohydrolase/phosphomutase
VNRRALLPLAAAGLLLALLLACGPGTDRGAGSAAPKVALIGIDGADWSVIRPLMEAGRLPNFARLASGGVSGDLRSYGQTMSPQIWNTIVTGKHYSEHGVDWFVVRADDPGRSARLDGDADMIPVTSRSRRVPALWDILSEDGQSVGVIGFWATWPATPVNGYLVSDRFSYSRVNKLAGADQDLRHQTHPAELATRLREHVMAPSQVSEADRARFMSGPVEKGDWRTAHDIVAEFDITYAQTETYRRVALDVLEDEQPDFFAVYFQGVDVISHYFWEFMRPEQSGHDIPAAAVARFGDTLASFYVYQDEILGEILARLSEDTVVIVTSDHGFRDLPFPDRKVPQTSGWHRAEGILIIHGPGVRRGVQAEGAGVFDVTPTVLALRGLPAAKDMPGYVMEAGFEVGGLTVPERIASYTSLPLAPEIPSDLARSPMDDEMVERLRSIGYLEGTPPAADTQATGSAD